MHTETRQIIQNSWQKVIPIADTAAGLFYRRLFEIDPEIKPFFQATDMVEQRKKLIQALSLVVNSVNQVEKVVPTLQELGRRHLSYGVRDEHYDTVGAALLWTLEQGLGAQWNAEVESAWTEAYTLVAGVMKAAAAEVDVTEFKTVA